MNRITSFLPQTLFGRIFVLYSASLFLFIIVGLGLFYYQQFTRAVDDAYESTGQLVDALTPTLSDSVVIGDYDTVNRSLERAAKGYQLASAEFIAIGGVRIVAKNPSQRHGRAPAWLSNMVSDELLPLNRNIKVGGRDYGILRLNFAPEFIADEIWTVTKYSLAIGLASLLIGQILILVPLRRISGELTITTKFASLLASHRGSLVTVDTTVEETRELAAALNKVSLELTAQHQALADSEARKSAVLAASLDALITIDTNGRIVDFNPAAEATFGYRREEAIGAVMGDLIVPPAFRQAHAQGVRHYLATGISPVLNKHIEISALRRDGSEFPVELSIAPFESGGQKYFLGSLRDITERKGHEAEQARVNALLNQSLRELEYQKFALDQHAIVSITDATGAITYANEKFSEISGYSRDELLGQTHRIVKSGMHPLRFYRDLWETISSGKVWHGQLANLKKKGGIYWVAATIVPWLDDAGLPYQYVAIRTDITAQKRIEHALEDARRRELKIGSDIQRSLLQGDFPEGIPGARLTTYTESSQGIDGDFFAVTRFRPDCFELLVGDVMGKGVPAALIGAGVKNSYNKILAELFAQRADEHQLPTPAEIINALHRSLTSRLIELSAFVTLALYRFDTTTGSLCVVNAGHTPGLLARGNGSSIERILGDNIPIGVIEEEVYLQQILALAPGDALLVYSDGLTEAFNGHREEFGIERLCAVLEDGRAASLPPSSLLQSMRQQVRNFVGSDVLDDDQTAVMVEMLRSRTPPRRGMEQRVDPSLLILPWRLDGLGALRTLIAETAGHLAEDEVQALILASFEAATNILRHAEPYFSDATIACRLTRRPDEYSVELIYPGPHFSSPDDPQPDFSGNSVGGFGLYIINNCVDAIEYASLMPGVSSVRLIKRTASERGAGLPS